MKTYTVKEIADLLGTNPETVRRWIRDGKLKAVANSKKKGENKVILEGALNAFLKTSPKYAATLAAPLALGAGAAALGVLGVTNAVLAVRKAKEQELDKERVGVDAVYAFLTTRIGEERTKLEALLNDRAELDQTIQIETELLNQLLDNLNELSDAAVNQYPKSKEEDNNESRE